MAPIHDNSGRTVTEFPEVKEKRVLPVVEFDDIPTASGKNNASYVYTYDGDGNLTKIEMTISGTTYEKSFTWTDSDLTGETTWSES